MSPRSSFRACCATALLVLLSCSETTDSKPVVGNAGGGAVSGAASGAGGRSATGGTSGAAGGAAGTLSKGGASGGSAMAGSGGAAAGTPSSGGAPGAGTGGSSGDAGAPAEGGAAGAPDQELCVLVFSKTEGFRHDSIPDARNALVNLGVNAGWTLGFTEDASLLDDETLDLLDVVVFLSTTGDVLNETQQAAFERFITSGKGWVGVHSASDTEYDWPFYGGLVGAYFREHPSIQQASLNVEDVSHPTMAGVPATWTRTDEWYAFQTNPRQSVHVLMSLDETSYTPGTANMGGDHPVAWWHEYEGGRAFYTALGHTSESYAEPVFLGQLERAIEWAGGR